MLIADDRWYRTAFGPLFAAFWTSLIPQERVEEEARFLAETLQVPQRGMLLDIPCGAGRHARALGRLGFRVDGIDISEHMLAASNESIPSGVTLKQGDMAALVETALYDGGYCWGNSFGYLTDDDSRAFLRRVAQSLKSGARFVLEYGAVAENILAAFQPHTDHSAAGFHFTAERRYDSAQSAMHIHYRVERDGISEEFVARQAVYTTAEILRM